MQEIYIKIIRFNSFYPGFTNLGNTIKRCANFNMLYYKSQFSDKEKSEEPISMNQFPH